MGSKYPVLPPRDIVKALEKHGFVFVAQRDNPMKYSNGERVVIIPTHIEGAKGTLKSILAMANITFENFFDTL